MLRQQDYGASGSEHKAGRNETRSRGNMDKNGTVGGGWDPMHNPEQSSRTTRRPFD